MKKLMMAAAVAAMCAGCVGTLVRKGETGDFRACRLAILYPFELGSVRVTTTNGTYELLGYRTSGGSSNVAEIAAAVTKAAIEGLK